MSERAPESTATAPLPRFGNLDFLDATSAEYAARARAYLREERRLAGADAVLPELTRWKGEGDDAYRARLREAGYINVAATHANTLAGHVERVRPMPGKGFSLGPMGEIRPVDQLQGRRSEAELFWYGADGTGNAANAFPKVAAGTQRRACATGHRWTFVEMPSVGSVRRGQGARGALRRFAQRVVGAIGRPTAADVEAGLRPYLLEWSPSRLPYVAMENGRVTWAVARVPVTRSRVVNGSWEAADGRPGYYLLVAEGCTDLGPTFEEGGWYLFDADKRIVVRDGMELHGRWDRTDGEVPLFPLVAAQGDAEIDASTAGAGMADLGARSGLEIERLLAGAGVDGSAARVLPLSRSLTMELGQIGIALMNRISERNWNFREACRSVNYILGVDPTDPDGFNLTVDTADLGAILVPVPAWRDDAGKWNVPTLWNSAAGLTDATAGALIIKSTLEEAREVMVRQLQAGADQSGEAKQVEFASGTSPLLADMLLSRASWEGNVVYWVNRRAGYSHDEAWAAFSNWPREVELRPVLDDIDAMFLTLTRSGASSATLTTDMLVQSGTERRVIRPESAKAIRAELAASLAAQARAAEAGRRQAAADAATLGLGGGEDDVPDVPPPASESAP